MTADDYTTAAEGIRDAAWQAWTIAQARRRAAQALVAERIAEERAAFEAWADAAERAHHEHEGAKR